MARIATTPLEIQLLAALKQIARYQSIASLRRTARGVGLTPDEHVEMAYENVIQTAHNAVRGVRTKEPTQ